MPAPQDRDKIGHPSSACRMPQHLQQQQQQQKNIQNKDPIMAGQENVVVIDVPDDPTFRCSVQGKRAKQLCLARADSKAAEVVELAWNDSSGTVHLEKHQGDAALRVPMMSLFMMSKLGRWDLSEDKCGVARFELPCRQVFDIVLELCGLADDVDGTRSPLVSPYLDFQVSILGEAEEAEGRLEQLLGFLDHYTFVHNYLDGEWCDLAQEEFVGQHDLGLSDRLVSMFNLSHKYPVALSNLHDLCERELKVRLSLNVFVPRGKLLRENQVGSLSWFLVKYHDQLLPVSLRGECSPQDLVANPLFPQLYTSFAASRYLGRTLSMVKLYVEDKEILCQEYHLRRSGGFPRYVAEKLDVLGGEFVVQRNSRGSWCLLREHPIQEDNCQVILCAPDSFSLPVPPASGWLDLCSSPPEQVSLVVVEYQFDDLCRVPANMRYDPRDSYGTE